MNEPIVSSILSQELPIHPESAQASSARSRLRLGSTIERPTTTRLFWHFLRRRVNRVPPPLRELGWWLEEYAHWGGFLFRGLWHVKSSWAAMLIWLPVWWYFRPWLSDDVLIAHAQKWREFAAVHLQEVWP